MRFPSIAGLLVVASWCTALALPLFPREPTQTIFTFARGFYTYPQYQAQRQEIAKKYVQRALDAARAAADEDPANTQFRDPFVVRIKGGAHPSPSDGIRHITFYLTDPDACGAVDCTGHAYVFADPDPELVKAGNAEALVQAGVVDLYKGVIFSGSKRKWGKKALPSLSKAKLGDDVIALDKQPYFEPKRATKNAAALNEDSAQAVGKPAQKATYADVVRPTAGFRTGNGNGKSGSDVNHVSDAGVSPIQDSKDAGPARTTPIRVGESAAQISTDRVSQVSNDEAAGGTDVSPDQAPELVAAAEDISADEGPTTTTAATTSGSLDDSVGEFEDEANAIEVEPEETATATSGSVDDTAVDFADGESTANVEPEETTATTSGSVDDTSGEAGGETETTRDEETNLATNNEPVENDPQEVGGEGEVSDGSAPKAAVSRKARPKKSKAAKKAKALDKKAQTQSTKQAKKVSAPAVPEPPSALATMSAAQSEARKSLWKSKLRWQREHGKSAPYPGSDLSDLSDEQQQLERGALQAYQESQKADPMGVPPVLGDYAHLRTLQDYYPEEDGKPLAELMSLPGYKDFFTHPLTTRKLFNAPVFTWTAMMDVHHSLGLLKQGITPKSVIEKVGSITDNILH